MSLLSIWLGYLGAGVLLGSYLARSTLSLCLATSVGLALMAGHFWFLLAYTSSVMCALGALRALATPKVALLSRKARTLWTVSGIALTLAVGLVSWTGWESAPALLAAVLAVVFGFNLQGAAFRHSLLVLELLFALNAMVVHSVPALLLSLGGLALNIAFLARAKQLRLSLRGKHAADAA